MEIKTVTPQMYGAKGDGKTDDSAAFQQAVDSGFDVYVPTTQKEKYIIKKTIKITNASCKRIYSEPFARRSNAGCIVADFTDADDPKKTALFDINMCSFTLGGLRVLSQSVDDHRAGILISAMNEKVCDYDIRIEHCSINNFYKVADMQGRGLEMLSSQFTSSNYLATLYWDDNKDTNKTHPAMYDQRAIAVKNCRLHNISSGFITVKSGHAYGLHFEGNTIDNGRGYLIRATEQAFGWNISGNVIQGINGDFDFMDFRKGMRNCVITGNTFLADEEYWPGAAGAVNTWLKCGGNTTACIINSNVFKNTNTNFIVLTNMDGSTIVGNAMYAKTKPTGAAINVTGTAKRSTIVGNAVAGTENIKLLTKALPKTNTVIGNNPSA